MQEFRVAIVGGRSFNNYTKMCFTLDRILRQVREKYKVIIVCGGARGADLLGKRYAQTRGIEVEDYPADWDTHGKSAGYIRNTEMANVSNAVIAFWDGESRGTRHMINTSRAKNRMVRVYDFDCNPM